MLAEALSPGHIPCVPIPLPPFALTAPAFRFRHLAGLAGRAPIGGAREVALACFVAARLAAECGVATEDLQRDREARYAGAKAWLSTMVLPAPVRGAAARCAELSVSGAALDMSREIATLMHAASSHLDAHARAELSALSAQLLG